MDTKDWAGMREVFVDDVVIDTRESGGDRIEGADTFMAILQDALGEATTVPQGHMPELDVYSAATPPGIWSLNDILIWPNGMPLAGHGPYHATYEQDGCAWPVT